MHILEYLKYVILAITQGVSEVLPISSSGHLQIAQKYLGMDVTSLTFPILLHFGSLIAMMIYYRKMIMSLIQGFYSYVFKRARDEKSSHYFRLSLCIMISSIPAGIIGILLKSTIEAYFSDIFFIGISFIFTGILLLLYKTHNGKSLNDLSFSDALYIGCFQAIGIIPGISRSGITISGCNKRKLNSEDSANYTFLLFIPVALGSFLLEIFSFFKGTNSVSISILPSLLAILISSLVTFISLKVFLKIIKNGKLHYFSYYLFLLGALIIGLNF